LVRRSCARRAGDHRVAGANQRIAVLTQSEGHDLAEAFDQPEPKALALQAHLEAIARLPHLDVACAHAHARAVEVLTPSRERIPPRAEHPGVPWQVLPYERQLEVKRAQVEEALRRIGDQHRRVLVETYLRGRPYAEVAMELGVPEGTIKSRVYYGLRALRNALEEMGYDG